MQAAPRGHRPLCDSPRQKQRWALDEGPVVPPFTHHQPRCQPPWAERVHCRRESNRPKSTVAFRFQAERTAAAWPGAGICLGIRATGPAGPVVPAFRA